MASSAVEREGPSSWDPVVVELRRRRSLAGEPSYAEIAQRVTDHRIEAGAAPHSARVARSTVYDTFRTGRARIDVVLVRDVALVLGATDTEVDGWLESRTDTPAEQPTEQPTEQPAGPARPGVRSALLLLVGCVLLNLLGRVLVEPLDLPLHLDMVGTAIAAIALGPWRGAAVGVVTNLAGAALSGPISVPFALVNVAGALVWGYGVRRWGLGRTLPRFLALNVLVAVVSTLLAVLVVTLVLGDDHGRPEASIADRLGELTGSLWLALAVANLLVSLADKVITGFVALVAISTLPVPLRRGLPLVGDLTGRRGSP